MRYLPENWDRLKNVVSRLWTEKAPGSEGELKRAVSPPDVWSRGVAMPAERAGTPVSKLNVAVDGTVGGGVGVEGGAVGGAAVGDGVDVEGDAVGGAAVGDGVDVEGGAVGGAPVGV